MQHEKHFYEKSYTKSGRETSSRAFSEKLR